MVSTVNDPINFLPNSKPSLPPPWMTEDDSKSHIVPIRAAKP